MKRSSRMKSRVKRSKNRRYSKNRYTKRRVKRSKKKTKRGRAHIKTRKVFGGSPTREEVEAGPVGWTLPPWGDYTFDEQQKILGDIEGLSERFKEGVTKNEIGRLYADVIKVPGNDPGSHKVEADTIKMIRKAIFEGENAVKAEGAVKAEEQRASDVKRLDNFIAEMWEWINTAYGSETDDAKKYEILQSMIEDHI
jgi:hypothetical protein